MIGTLIGAGLSATGAIFGGITSAKAAREANAKIAAQKQKNQNWYDRRYNEDATQRADAQRILTMTEESIKKRNQQAAGAAAVAGGTEESIAAAKEAGNKALADATSAIAAQAEARKDNIEATYLQNDAAYTAQQIEADRQKSQAIAQAIGGVANAGASIAGAF